MIHRTFISYIMWKQIKTNFSKANKGGRFDGRKEDEGLQLYVK